MTPVAAYDSLEAECYNLLAELGVTKLRPDDTNHGSVAAGWFREEEEEGLGGTRNERRTVERAISAVSFAFSSSLSDVRAPQSPRSPSSEIYPQAASFSDSPGHVFPSSTPDPCVLLCENLPIGAKDSDLVRRFRGFKLVRVIIKIQEDISSASALITFETPRDAQQAIARIHGNMLGSRQMSLRVAPPDQSSSVPLSVRSLENLPTGPRSQRPVPTRSRAPLPPQELIFHQTPLHPDYVPGEIIFTNSGEERDPCTLFILPVTSEFDEQRLAQYFGIFGRVKSARLVKAGSATQVGFVTFEDASAAHKALQQTHNQFVGGVRSSVQYAKSKTKSIVGSRRVEPEVGGSGFELHVRPLDDGFTSAQLRSAFEPFGSVQGVRVRGGKGDQSDYGFVTFARVEDAKRAQREMDHTKLGSKFIDVMFSKRDQLAPKTKRHREQDEQRPEWTSSTRRRLSEEDLESYHKGGSSSKGKMRGW
ncbi:hypothetical protein BDY24DRAFT_389441 [Mrakia frigida]|uniref:uncharacterized protein n=1 Tax=Mrakia frigida TaxID=29902 RepID=UPI003FCC070F